MSIQKHLLISPAPGTQRELISLHYGQGGGEKAYIQASLHADELPGMLVAHHLRTKLDALQAAGRICGEIVLVPMANPIGLSQFVLHMQQGRFETTTGENFNRHYPEQVDAVARAAESQLGADATRNVEVLRRELRQAVAASPATTELQSLRRTLMSLSCDADYVLDLHCDAQALMHLYTEKPCWPVCEDLARFIGARVTLLAQESGDNPFDEACSQLWWKLQARFGNKFPIPQACMSVTVELRGAADVEHTLAEQDAQNIIDFLHYRGLITGAKPTLPAAQGDARPLAGSMPIKAPCPGVLTFVRQVGDTVKAGDVLAHIIDPISAQVTELKSPVDGLFFARDFVRFANTGMSVAKVAGREALRTGKLLGA
ncbi:succinylglutamate desuccinylase/aspartoacylase family protein [Roseateles koreensis]|uniref:Succinylglutamate desuccinylase/aspartoacylase family protein n=1 Tax=Roseateles koreensis TaxID=2987526 RepID=A0ABT5KW58_9BURK|nr:M14 family metallopeptidase [Roseateles koreensis]MDC8787174.1 succinylglutamate desuccinylase/aspartoacylase family protein [Roseateles koreensis]